MKRETGEQDAPGQFATYEEALDYLFKFTNYETMGRFNITRDAFDLERMRQLLAWCGNPESRIPVIVHIAGTKGKGSTCWMVAALLRATGRRVGMYTSPHLEDLRERIDIDGQWITKAAFTRHLSEIRPFLDSPREGQPPTFFDIMTAIAIKEFAEQKCDAAAVEVGLGGRLDSTNVLVPTVTAITRIHFDHVDKLGESIAQIAREKAGILKPGVPAVIGPQLEDAQAVITRRAAELRVRLWRVGREIIIEPPGKHGCISVTTPIRKHPALALGCKGVHQSENAAVAIGILDCLHELVGIDLPPGLARSVLQSIQVPGRVEVFPGSPAVILDSAHNGVSAQALARAIRDAFPRKKAILVLGIASDKDLAAILEALLPISKAVIATAAQSPRALRPGQLSERIKAVSNVPVQEAGPAEAALKTALETAEADDIVVVAGSFYLAGEVRPLLRSRESQKHG